MDQSPNDIDERARGCMLGGAVGDALGAPVEFLSLQHIRNQFGPAGLVDFAPAYGKCGAITHDTQMALFTADGLLRGEAERRRSGSADFVRAVHQAYLRWLLTQQEASSHKFFPQATRREMLGWLYRLKPLRSRRAPGTTCILGLRNDVMGTIERPINSSKGCGGLMRVAPVGIFFEDPEVAFEMGARLAAMTHGHPSGYLAAGTFSALIHLLVCGKSLEVSLDGATTILRKYKAHEECLHALERARHEAAAGEPSPDAVEGLGSGWVAEEALAISVFASLSAERDYARGVLLAVNHSGDSDSTASIAGSILGSKLGAGAIPVRWLQQLELKDAIEQIAADLNLKFIDDPGWGNKYPI
jgi:ADP-ribosyl-[dinitrogen reductase] hydrolase